MESAFIGVLTLTLVAGLTEAWMRSTRRSRLADSLWGVWLSVAACLYAWLGREMAIERDLIVVALLLIWASAYIWDAKRFRLAFEAVGATTQHSERHWLRTTVEIFFVSAPILLICTDPQSLHWHWSDVAAIVTFLCGMALVWQAHRPRRLSPSFPKILARKPTLALGYTIAFLAFYLFALAVPAGYLTFFAVAIVAQHMHRVLDERSRSGTSNARDGGRGNGIDKNKLDEIATMREPKAAASTQPLPPQAHNGPLQGAS